MCHLFALVVVPAWLPKFATTTPVGFRISELTQDLTIAGRHKVVFLGLAMKFVTSTLFRSIC